MKELSVEEIIQYAIRIEEESYGFYTKATEQVTHDEVIPLIKELADEEIKHQNRLRDLLHEKKITAQEMARKFQVDTTIMDRIVQTSVIKPDADALEVLSVALERENHTHQTYSMLMTFSNLNPVVMDLFEDLRNQEKGHANKIQSRMKKIQ